jgi:hypothetical protein
MTERVEDCPRCHASLTVRFNAAGKGVCTECRWWCNPPGSRSVKDLRGDDTDDPNGWEVRERRLARDGR